MKEKECDFCSLPFIDYIKKLVKQKTEKLKTTRTFDRTIGDFLNEKTSKPPKANHLTHKIEFPNINDLWGTELLDLKQNCPYLLKKVKLTSCTSGHFQQNWMDCSIAE